MKKIFFLPFAAALFLSSTCNAGPLTNYSLGNASLDVAVGQSNLSSSSNDDKNQIASSCQLTVAAGLGFGGQYQISSVHINDNYHGNNRLITHQIRLIDNLISIADASISVFAGASQTELTGDLNKTGAIVGVIGTMPLSAKASAYTVLTAGNHLSSQELGLSYKLNTTTEVNLAYTNAKYNDLVFSNNTRDSINQETFSLGLTYKI